MCKRFAADDRLIPAMEELARDELEIEEKIRLGFALGKALRDAGQFERSFGYVAQASALKRSHVTYNESSALAFFRHLPEIFCGTGMAEKSGLGHHSPLPVFVTGLPRSGTTLIEQILACHQVVFSAGEIDNFKTAIVPTFGGFPEELRKDFTGRTVRTRPALC